MDIFTVVEKLREREGEAVVGDWGGGGRTQIRRQQKEYGPLPVCHLQTANTCKVIKYFTVLWKKYFKIEQMM
jgi:hypothetical protein